MPVDKSNFKRTSLKRLLTLGLILGCLILFLTLDLVTEFSFFKILTKIVSAFDVNPAPQPGSNLTVCTAAISNNDCNLQPTLSWSITSGTQVSYAVQIDNNGWLPKSPPSTFPSPEVDTGEVALTSNSYAVPSGKLAFGTTYYWQIAVKDNFGSWSGWTEADTPFTTPTFESCTNFTISAAPASQNIAHTDSTGKTYTVTITSVNSFNSAVTLSLSGCPTGATCSFSSNPVTPPAGGSVNSTLTVRTNNTPVATYSLTITGTSGSLSYSTSVTLTVTNNLPVVSNLQVTPPSNNAYCGSNPSYLFTWSYSDLDGDAQQDFTFQVARDSAFTQLAVNNTVIGSSNQQQILVVVSPSSGQIGYNQRYYWRVSVTDSYGASSGWYYPPNTQTPPGTWFRTADHLYPTVGFTWSPTIPSAQETVQFTDKSECYNLSNNVVPCSSWTWNMPSGTSFVSPDTANSQSPAVQFQDAGTYAVSLQVTDSDGYSCTGNASGVVGGQTIISVRLPLPGWKEVPPQ